MPSERYTLTVPHEDNDGRDLTDVHQTVRRRLAEIADGWTEFAARGGWRSDTDDLHWERTQIYVVDVPASTPVIGARLTELARYVKQVAAQEAVYLTRQQIDTWLI